MADNDVKYQAILQLLESFREDNSDDHKEILKILREQNGRIRKNEGWRKTVTGIAIGLGLGAGVSGAALFKYLSELL